MTLTPEEFKAMRTKCGLSFLVVAAHFGVSKDTVRKTWEKTGNYVPEQASNWLVDYHDSLCKEAQEKADWIMSLEWEQNIIVLPAYRDHFNLGKTPQDKALLFDLRKQYVLNFAEDIILKTEPKYKIKHVWFGIEAYQSFLDKRKLGASFNNEILWAISERLIIDPDLRDNFFSSADLYLARLKAGLSVRDVSAALNIDDGDVMRIEWGFVLDNRLIAKAKEYRALLTKQ